MYIYNANIEHVYSRKGGNAAVIKARNEGRKDRHTKLLLQSPCEII